MVASKCRCRFAECPDGSPFGTCHISPHGYCFTYFEQIQDESRTYRIEKRFGCFTDDDSIFQCKGYLSNHHIYKNISCCKSKDYCNDDLLKEINDGEIIFEENDLKTFYTNSLIYISIILLIILVFTIVMCFKKFNEKNKKFKKADEFNSQKLLLPVNFEVEPRTPFPVYKTLPYSIGSNNSTSDSSSSSGIFIKYSALNTSQNSSTMDSNYVSTNMAPYVLSSFASNTTSSFMSENTQQTILSSQKFTSLPPVNEDATTSGSGSGVPRLIQKTIAREIDLKRYIGQGRFGRVWHGVRHCEQYAVKIFYSRHEASWKRENEIYQGTIMRHENIVTFFGTDIISSNGCTQLWLITEYHQLGSLYDYLNRKPITSIQQMISIMKSIIFGLSHLHTEVNGTQGKPIIAHRDLKSKNILMKSENSCCISDFASAAIKNHVNIVHYHYGTIRYMSPEILNDSIHFNYFEEYLYADIYSLGLVFWEIFNRLQINRTIANEYSKPYQEYVPDKPTIEDMRKVVCQNKIRPYLNENLGNQVLMYISQLIKECWSDNPYARLTSLRIKKTIIDIQRNHL